MAELNYEQDIAIDENALDIEWLNQPSLMMKYVRALAEKERQYDQLKEELSVLEAELDRDIRSNPSDFGVSKDIKITEAVVKGCITTDEEYKKLQEEIIDARYEVSIHKGAVRALDQRKSALEDLVKLHGQQYFAGPKVPRDISYERQQKHDKEQSNKTISISRKNKGR